ncbi:condensation domain-containing protein, partial [Luedemannella flava]|uniref:condensation domain-containing protein n=1 Tax=Luedemannella flava TaxID=349316 RepID=UPI0031D9D4B1
MELSSAQRRLWFLGQLEGPSPTYNAPTIVRLRGQLDVGALGAALRDVIVRHESLRTVFPTSEGEPYQHIIDPDELRWELTVVPSAELRHTDLNFLDLGDLTEGPARNRLSTLDSSDGPSAADDLAEAIVRASRTAIDLSVELPLKAWLWQVDPDDHVLVLVLHHIAGDGWSMGPLGQDLSTAYAARVQGQAPHWEPLAVQYADYTLWQRELLGREDDPDSRLSVQVDYWRDALAGVPEELALPFDRPRPAVASHRGHSVPLRVPAAVHQRMVRLAQAEGATPFMVLHAAVAVLLSRLGAGVDIPIGSAVAGRTDEALDDLIGCFVNTLVIRTDLDGDPTFRDVLGRVREAGLGALTHQDVPFERLVEELAPARSLARHPLFQVVLTMLNPVTAAAEGVAEETLRLPGLRSRGLFAGKPTAKFDLDVLVGEVFDVDGGPAGLRGAFTVADDLFNAPAAGRIADWLVRVLDLVTGAPDLRLHEVRLIDPQERDLVVRAWNDTAVEGTAESVVRLFERQAAARPDAVALVTDDIHLTYAQLDARSGAIAGYLRSLGVGPDSVVGLCLPRGAETVAAILGVWKAGGAYLPIDGGLPVERIGFMLTDSRALVVLGDSDTVGDLPAGRRVRLVALDDPLVAAVLASGASTPAGPVDPDRLAYVMYTSGSTGVPKGVGVTQGAVANYVRSVSDRVGWTEPGSRYALLQPQVTDLGNTVLFTSLATGGELHVLDADTVMDPQAVADYFAEHRIDAVKVVPSHLAALAAEVGVERLVPAGSLILGGEAAPVDWLDRLLAAAGDRRVFNHYGPTE